MILALDPGLSMGAARRDDDNSIHTTVVKGEYYLWLADHIKMADIVVVEQFQADNINKYGLFTVELVGAICALSEEHSVKCYRHAPGFRKAMQQKAHDYLRGLKKRFVIHEEDALAHLFMYEATGK